MNIILITKKEKEQGLPVSDKRVIHILEILKKKEKEVISLGIEGEEYIWEASFTKKEELIFFNLIKREKLSPKPSPLTLILGLSRPLVMKRLLKDASALGVKKLIIVKTELSDKSYLQSSLWKEEVNNLLKEGAIQAKSTYIPEFFIYPNMNILIESLPKENNLSRWVLHPYENSLSLINQEPSNQGVIMAIGSERGWTKREIELFEANNFTSLSMSKRILRTETATIAGLYLVQEKLQEKISHLIQK